MRFGTLGTAGFHGDFDQTIAWARRLEEAGFSYIGTSDSPGLYRDTFVTQALLARSTTRAMLGTWVTNPVLRHPAVTAGAIASIAELSKGRAVLGIGSGDSAVRNVGERAATLAEMEEYILAVRGLLERGEASYRGRRLLMRWKAPRVPIYIAASGPKTLRLAGRIADGAIIAVGCDPQTVEDCLGWLAEGAREAGKDPKTLDVWWALLLSVGKDRASAIEDIRFGLASRAHHTFRPGFEGKRVPERFQAPLRELVRSYRSIEHGITQHTHNANLARDLGLTEFLAQRFAVTGTAEECVAQLKALELVGVTNIMPSLHSGRGGFQFEEFAGQVMPAFREEVKR